MGKWSQGYSTLAGWHIVSLCLLKMRPTFLLHIHLLDLPSVENFKGDLVASENVLRHLDLQHGSHPHGQ